MVTVSHDRTFLDAVCTDNLHLSGAAKRLTQVRHYTSHVCMHHSMRTVQCVIWAAWGGVARMTFFTLSYILICRAHEERRELSEPPTLLPIHTHAYPTAFHPTISSSCVITEWLGFCD